MASIAAAVERSRSVSSTRRMNTPPLWRVKRKLNSAVRAPPMCRKPVGLGAKRVRTVDIVVRVPATLRAVNAGLASAQAACNAAWLLSMTCASLIGGAPRGVDNRRKRTKGGRAMAQFGRTTRGGWWFYAPIAALLAVIVFPWPAHATLKYGPIQLSGSVDSQSLFRTAEIDQWQW